ncbi:hypothetical protein BKK54_09440 [Rodentibacter genomosp. 1]|uniref:Transposase n=1 Tax=Rodentibacter genomosp. 1 TaxID=1908264 RepID=A0A1V3J262_9PAST|nr:transposase [Rodentibacter genomosp. 1]OOF49135.1 hypothetical protein BKK54_09440 [Rodentibacter genomosp. 1]
MVKKFTPDYKKQCVEMDLAKQHTTVQICKTMGVSQSAINRWVRQFQLENQGITPKAAAITAK